MSGKWRQKLHLEPPQGWMNDPNGLCWFNGKYHVFFQYSPDSAEGAGDRGWGHYESEDMLEWTFTGFVIRPDSPDDKDGAFSGCAVVHEGIMHIFYTGNVMEEGDHDYVTSGRGANVIHVSSTDGTHFSEKQTIIRSYPEFCSNHVRDPKIWREGEEWRMVLGARTLDDRGIVLYYSSKDLEKWEYMCFQTVSDHGYMWECPDRFALDGKSYLSLSPQGMERERYRLQNLFHSGYFRADGDITGGLYDFEEWDYGFDFYAPQTFEAPDGRRIMYGWFGIGDTSYTNHTIPLGWQHCLTLPRELTADENGQLIQRPVRELERLRRECFSLPCGQKKRVALPFDLCAQTSGDFVVKIDDMSLCFSEGVFSMRFLSESLGAGRTERLVRLEECGEIRIVADMSSVEVYLDGGRRVLSTRFYPDGEDVSLLADGFDSKVYMLG